MTLINTTNLMNNSEIYRYNNIRKSSLIKNEEEQMLQLIAKNDLAEELRKLHENGLDLNYRFSQGNRLIHMMAQYDAVDCLSYLLNHDGNVNSLSGYGSTPLENARALKAKNAEDFLIKHGGKANIITLCDLIKRTDINEEDKRVILRAISFNDEMTDILHNVKGFVDEIILSAMSRKTISALLLRAKDLLMQDHLNKLAVLKDERIHMNYGLVNDVLLKYELTAQQAQIFRSYYLNRDLMTKLQEIMKMLKNNMNMKDLKEAGLYLNNILL